MDDYLFIVLAKLQADRLKLQREQHAGAEPTGEPAHSGEHHSHRARRFNPGSEWSEAQLGKQ